MGAELHSTIHFVSYRGKVRSEAVGLPKQTKELLQEGESFWRNRRVHPSIFQTIPSKEWRKIRQQYVEMPMSEEANVIRHR